MPTIIQRLTGFFAPKNRELADSASIKQVQKVEVVDNTITVQQMYRTKKSIQDWRQAIQSWESVYNPLRKQLLEIYDLISEDSFVSEMTDRRIRNITNSRIEVFKDGKIQEDIQKTLNAVWFNDLIKYALESKFYGHSLIEFKLENGEIKKINLIPRHHVRPELGIICKNHYAENQGILYREPPYSNFIVEVGGEKDKGILWKAFPHTTTKKGTLIDWGQHSEMFGMPIRVYTYDPMQPAARYEAEQAAQNAGGAAYIVVPKGTGLELHQGSDSASSDMYSALKEACNDEIGMLICGENMRDGQSYKESEVKQTKFEEIKLDDKTFIESVLNETIKPILIGFGFALTDCEFKFNESEKLSIEKRILIDEKIATQVNIPAEYWYEAYSIPMPKDGNFEPKKTEISGNFQKPTEKKKTNLSDLYADLCCEEQHEYQLDETDDAEYASIVESIANALFAGTLTLENFTLSINYKKLTEKIFTKLWAGVEEGYGMTLVGLEVGSPDFVFLTELRSSQAIFAAHKAYNLIEQLNTLLIQEWDTITKADFIKKAMVLNTKWNKIWFEAEYRTAIQSAISARQWKEIQADKDLFPFLQYKTVQDGNVRPEHAVLHNITRAVDDKFWLTYYPPNGWSCRCNVLKQGDWVTPTPDTVLSGVVANADIPDVFKNNVGVTSKIFNESHPFYDVSPETKKKCTDFSAKL